MSLLEYEAHRATSDAILATRQAAPARLGPYLATHRHLHRLEALHPGAPRTEILRQLGRAHPHNPALARLLANLK